MHGVVANVNPRTDRLHEGGCDDIARDGGGRRHAEEEDEHRRDEGCAAHAGEADHDPGEESAEGEHEVDVLD